MLALAKDYDAGPDGTYKGSAVTSDMEGTFEGLGHTISNFSASGGIHAAGFFLQSQDGAVRDLTLSHASVKAGDQVTAGLLGGGLGGNIINVHSSGSVSVGDSGHAGGLVGVSFGELVKSDSSATVNCAKRCYAGGLVGEGHELFLSHASGTVTITSGIAGGLVGLLYELSRVSQSFATGDVVSVKPQKTVRMGGLVGYASQDASIMDSYAQGAIRNTGAGSLGGLLGISDATEDASVATSYATGHIGIEGLPFKQIGGNGGFVGTVYSPVQYTQDYWDTDTTGTSIGCGASKPAKTCPKIDGLTDIQLRSALPAGFNTTIWAQHPSVNNGYPYLINNPPPQ